MRQNAQTSPNLGVDLAPQKGVVLRGPKRGPDRVPKWVPFLRPPVDPGAERPPTGIPHTEALS